MEYVAHRAGNSVEGLRTAEGVVDLVEVDVHAGRHDRVEVRHAKTLWPTDRLWERWYLEPSGVPVPSLAEIVDAARPDTSFWLDIKGVHRGLVARALALTDGHRPITVSAKAWWLLGQYVDVAGVRTVRSAGNRFELALLRWLPSRTKVDGAVVHQRLLTGPVIRRLAAHGLVFTWGVVDTDRIRWLEANGVDGVIVDDLSLVPPR